MRPGRGETGYALFDTAIGLCGIAWGEVGIRAVTLPETDRGRAVARLKLRAPQAKECAPTPAIATVIADIVALLSGEARELAGAVLDFEGLSPFERRVLALAREVGRGRTTTYGELARRAGEPGAARAVGAAMGANPFPIIVPCHRVVGADGAIGGFSAHGGAASKARLLSIEKARIGAAPALFEDLPVTLDPRAHRGRDPR